MEYQTFYKCGTVVVASKRSILLQCRFDHSCDAYFKIFLECLFPTSKSQVENDICHVENGICLDTFHFCTGLPSCKVIYNSRGFSESPGTIRLYLRVCTVVELCFLYLAMPSKFNLLFEQILQHYFGRSRCSLL